MTNGAMNVEIGNPTYKMYEGGEPDDVGGLLDADFALDPDKVGREGRGGASRTGMGAVGGATKPVGLDAGMEAGGRYLSPRALCLSPSCTLLLAAHQLHEPRVRHTVHGGPRQPPLPGQHGREARTPGPGPRGRDRGPLGIGSSTIGPPQRASCPRPEKSFEEPPSCPANPPQPCWGV